MSTKDSLPIVDQEGLHNLHVQQPELWGQEARLLERGEEAVLCFLDRLETTPDGVVQLVNALMCCLHSLHDARYITDNNNQYCDMPHLHKVVHELDAVDHTYIKHNFKISNQHDLSR